MELVKDVYEQYYLTQKVQINGIWYNALVDTGSTGLILCDSVVTDCGIKTKRGGVLIGLGEVKSRLGTCTIGIDNYEQENVYFQTFDLTSGHIFLKKSKGPMYKVIIGMEQIIDFKLTKNITKCLHPNNLKN